MARVTNSTKGVQNKGISLQYINGLAVSSKAKEVMSALQAGMFPVVSRRWKVSPKKRTVWDNLDSDSDYEPSGDEEDKEEPAEEEGEGKGQEEEQVSFMNYMCYGSGLNCIVRYSVCFTHEYCVTLKA